MAAFRKPKGAIDGKSKPFVEAMAIPGVRPVKAYRATMPKLPADDKIGILAYKKNRALQNRIEERKVLAAQFANLTPEMVLGATAMRAFASIEDAYDEDGNFDMKLARKSGAIHLVKSLTPTERGIKAEFYSNESAQDKLGNYLGMEFAPKDNNDAESLKAGVDAVAKAIALEMGTTEITHEIRVLAWERVSLWAQDHRAKYSREAIVEVGKEFQKQLLPENP